MLTLQRYDGYTALLLAAENGHVDVARLLLEAGADKGLQRHDGYTALMLAEESGHGDVAELLRAKAPKITWANRGSEKSPTQGLGVYGYMQVSLESEV